MSMLHYWCSFSLLFDPAVFSSHQTALRTLLLGETEEGKYPYSCNRMEQCGVQQNVIIMEITDLQNTIYDCVTPTRISGLLRINFTKKSQIEKHNYVHVSVSVHSHLISLQVEEILATLRLRDCANTCEYCGA